MKLNVCWRQKETAIEAEKCTVEDVVELPSDTFDYFKEHLLVDADFLKEHSAAMFYEKDGVHALLVLGEGQNDGILIDAQGYSYARNTAFVPNARQLLQAEIKQLANYIVREGTEYTEDGKWSNTYEELYNHFGSVVSDTNGTGQLLKEELEQRDEVAECVLCEDCIEIGYHLEHCPACQQGGIEGAASVLSLVGCNIEDNLEEEPTQKL